MQNNIFYANNAELIKFISDRFNIECYSNFSSYYPDFASLSNCDSSNSTGIYFEKFLSSCYRDNRVSWRDALTEAKRLSSIFKSEALKVLDGKEILYFSNIPHEGFDIILAETAEELGMKWFAPWQVPTDPLSFQVFTNGFSLVSSGNSNFYVSYNDPIYYKQEILAKYKIISKAARNSAGTAPVLDRIYSKLHNIQQRSLNKKIFTDVPSKNSDLKRIVIALHKQPEASTDPLGFEYNDPIKMISLVVNHVERLGIQKKIEVIVKEHPVSSSIYRGRSFSSFANNIKKVGFVKFLKQEYSLANVENVQGVVTVNGTIGFEHLNRSGRVLCDSRAYYAGVEGCYEFTNASDFILSILDDSGFSRSTPPILKGLYGGIVDPLYCGYDYSSPDLINGYQQLLYNAN